MPPLRFVGSGNSSSGLQIGHRLDGIEPAGLDEALRRGELYAKSGADWLFLEGPRTVEEIERIGKTLNDIPLAVNMFEGDGRTPWLSPRELGKLGFSMILFPTTSLFRVTRAIERSVDDLIAGRPMPAEEGVDLDYYEEIVGLKEWGEIERKFHHEEH